LGTLREQNAYASLSDIRERVVEEDTHSRMDKPTLLA
jgi:hypothetical protein